MNDDEANRLTHELHEAAAAQLSPELHQIVLPHHAYMLTRLDTTTLVHLRALTPRECTVHGAGPAGCCGVDLDVFNTDVDTTDPRVALIVALVGDALHEALEQTSLGGERWIDPHSLTGEVLASYLHVWLAGQLHELHDNQIG